jgi:hypothetical protein
MSKSHSRRAVLAGIAAAPALAAPALALSEPDPIFAAIGRHRAAAEAFNAIVDEHSGLEDLIPADRRTANRRDDDASGDDPRWQDYQRRYFQISDEMEGAAFELFEAPKNIAGLAVILDYVEEECFRGGCDDAWSLPEIADILSALMAAVRRLQGEVS